MHGFWLCLRLCVSVDRMSVQSYRDMLHVKRHLGQYTVAAVKIAIQYGALDPDGRVFRRRQYLSIVTFLKLVWLAMHCGWQWPSMDTIFDLLWLAMAIDEQASQSFVAGSGHRWTRFTTYCGGQYILIDSVWVVFTLNRSTTSLLSPTISIARFPPRLSAPRPLSPTLPIDRHLRQCKIALGLPSEASRNFSSGQNRPTCGLENHPAQQSYNSYKMK